MYNGSISIPAGFVPAIVVTTKIGAHIRAQQANPSGTTAIPFEPLDLPDDFDQSRKSVLTMLVECQTTRAAAGEFITLGVGYTYLTPALGWFDGGVANYWPVPNPWTAGDLAQIPIEANPGEGTFPEGFFPGEHITLGLSLQRVGSDSSDNYPLTIYIARYLRFDYYRLCGFEQ